MIRNAANELLPGDTPCGTLIGVHDFLLCHLLPAAALSSPEAPLNSDVVTLENLADVRAYPHRYLHNRLDSVDGVIRELEIALTEVTTALGQAQQQSGPVWLIEAGSARTGRNLSGLRRLQEHFQGRVVILTGCLPEGGEVVAQQPQPWESIKDSLLLRLGFGLPVAGEGEGTDTRVGASFLGLLELRPDPLSWDRMLLQALAVASKESSAPLLVTVQDAWGEEPLFEEATLALAEVLLGFGAPADRVCICRLLCSQQYMSTYVALLAKGLKLSFTFHGGIFYGQSADLRCHPSDQEGAMLVSTLCQNGHAGQVLLSQGVCCKIQQRRFGGHGLAHIVKNVVPRLRRLGISEVDINLMMGGTWRSMVAFASPPPVIEKPVEMGRCSMCNKLFELREGAYFTKFKFVYCGTKCLRQHAQMGWKELPVT